MLRGSGFEVSMTFWRLDKYLLHIQQKEANMKPKRKLLRFREFVKQQNRQTNQVPTDSSAGTEDHPRQANVPSEISLGGQKMLEKKMLEKKMARSILK